MTSQPLLSFCQFALPTTTFEEDVKLCKEYGYAGMSIGEHKLRDGEDDDLVNLFLRSGLKAAACIPINIAPLPPIPAAHFAGPDDPTERVEAMCNSIRRLARFEPDSVVLITGSGQGRTVADAHKIAVEGLREGARVAAGFGMNVNIEPIRVSESFDGSWVHDVPSTVELLNEIGEPNVDIAYDVWHLWDTDNIVQLTEQHAAAIGAVHVCDWLPVAAPSERGFPGEGVIDLPALFGALERGGFTGWFDVEVFSSELGGAEPAVVFERGRDGFEAAWEARR